MPAKVEICCASCPRAASSPKTNPAIETTITRSAHTCLDGERKTERRADAFLAFDCHLPAVSFSKRFHDGET